MKGCAYARNPKPAGGSKSIREYSRYWGWGYWSDDGFVPDNLRCNGCDCYKCQKNEKNK